MGIVDKIKKRFAKKAVFGFNANVDYSIEVTPKKFKSWSSKIRKYPPLIETMESWIQSEVQITEKEKKIFSKIHGKKPSVGGQGGIGAQFASNLGTKCFTHSGTRSNKLLSKFNKKSNIFLSEKRGFRNIKSVSKSMDKKLAEHFVFEFKKDQKYPNFKIPKTDRFIASYDPPNFLMDEYFLDNIDKLKGATHAFLGGFHLVRSKKEMDYLIKIVKGLKIRDIKVHLELADFSNKNYLPVFKKSVLPICNSIGMNRHEFKQLNIDLTEVINTVGEIILHDSNGASFLPVDERHYESICFATICASYRAKTGKCPTWDTLKKYEKKTKFYHVDKPVSTVGLGDIFSAAFFLSH